MSVTGGCQCGAVRYALSETPVVTLCHCRMCQKAVGGPFAALATVKRAALAWTRGAPAHFQSSSMAKRGFCAACGTPLTYEGVNSENLEVTAGSLDDAASFAPTEAFGTEAKLAWVDDIAALKSIPTEAKFEGLVSYQHPDRDT
jgi:hypothetical protein